MARPRPLALLVVLSALVPACKASPQRTASIAPDGGHGGPPPSGAAVSSTARAPASPAEAADDADGARPKAAADILASVTLLDPGRPPRRKLRYAWRVDQKELLSMVLRTAASTESEGTRQPEVPLPTVHVAIAIDPRSVSPDGDMSYAWRVTSAAVEATEDTPSQMADGMRAEVAEIERLSGSSRVTSRGITDEVTIDPAADPSADAAAAADRTPESNRGGTSQMAEQIRQTLHDVAAPFPEEEVGAGARWRKLSQLDASDARITQTETFRLVELRGGGGTLDDTLAQTAPPQPLRGPGAQAGTQARLDSMLASGQASVRFDLSRLVAQSTFDGTTTMVLSGQHPQVGARRVTMVMRVAIAITGSRR
ncbi:MAG TPA: hypothetical protein VE987_17025 [Polyangiaceae bacterium]|nr:hypothetical protein [Polyangiaceae bacterium]